jgi:hypothetical protein
VVGRELVCWQWSSLKRAVTKSHFRYAPTSCSLEAIPVSCGGCCLSLYLAPIPSLACTTPPYLSTCLPTYLPTHHTHSRSSCYLPHLLFSPLLSPSSPFAAVRNGIVSPVALAMGLAQWKRQPQRQGGIPQAQEAYSLATGAVDLQPFATPLWWLCTPRRRYRIAAYFAIAL